jgi:ABC-type branched-subunit amino acid transport system substrate-binding protein
MTRLRLGACLSLTGRYGRFGRQAANGLQVWRRLVGEDVELEIEDDGSDPGLFATRLWRVASRSDLLLGPYSTQLMREAAGAMAEVDGVLWNHGGSADDVQALWPGRVVSVLAPTSRYAVPFVRTRAAEREQAPLLVVRGRGTFGRQVAAGAVAAARGEGLEAVEVRAGDGFSFEDVPDVWDLFSAGRFEDDVAIVKAAQSAPRPPRVIGSVAAGVQDFASEVGDADGVYGIAQWFPGRGDAPELGPAESAFLAAYPDVAGASPDYPAVQAAAGAVLATRCAELAGSLDRTALWEAAAGLDTSTLFGGFKIDPATGAQVKHTPVLVRWRDGAPATAGDAA